MRLLSSVPNSRQWKRLRFCVSACVDGKDRLCLPRAPFADMLEIKRVQPTENMPAWDFFFWYSTRCLNRHKLILLRLALCGLKVKHAKSCQIRCGQCRWLGTQTVKSYCSQAIGYCSLAIHIPIYPIAIILC